MFNIILIIIIFSVAGLWIFVQKQRDKSKKVVSVGGVPLMLVVTIISTLLLLFAVVRVVPPGIVGVQVQFGSVLKRTLPNGLHIISPFVELKTMDVRLQEYTMSGYSEEGRRSGDDTVEILTKEGLKVKLDMSAWYFLDPEKAQMVYREIGMDYQQKVVRPLLRTVARDVSASYSVNDFTSSNRPLISQQIFNEVSAELVDKGIIMDKILLRNIILPDTIQEAIEAKQAADQKAKEMEHQIRVAELEAKRKAVEARGIADANRIIGAGLTTRYIQWYRIDMMKQLVDSPNNTIIFIPEDMNATPLVNIGGGGQ